MLKAEMNDWVAMLGIVGAMAQEITIVTDGERAKCLAVDPAHVLFVKASIACEGTEPTFTVSAEQMLKAIVAAGGKEQTVELNEEKGSIRITGNAKVNLPMLEYGTENPLKDITQMSMYQEKGASSTFKSSMLEPLISYGIYQKEVSVVFSIADGSLNVTIGEGHKSSEVNCGPAEGESTVKCSLDYFSTISKQSKNEDITLSMFGDAKPMVFSWNAGSTAEIYTVLAPWIEDN